jgi:hypothetical protein
MEKRESKAVGHWEALALKGMSPGSMELTGKGSRHAVSYAEKLQVELAFVDGGCSGTLELMWRTRRCAGNQERDVPGSEQ